MAEAPASAAPGRPAGLAAGLSRASLLMAVVCAAGVGLAALMVRHLYVKQRAVDRAAAAAAATHTIHTAAMTQT